MTQHSLFATCPRGLEAVLATELVQVGAQQVQARGGGASFSGDLEVCYRVNLESRVATRVLLAITQAPYRNEQDIYELARAVRWRDWFDVGRTMRVDVNAIRCPLKSLDFVTLRIKDAICDRFRDDVGSRPNVDTHSPEVRIAGFLDARSFTLYLDTSGEPLYKRGIRGRTGDAPLKENLAAGIIALSGWRPEEPFLDPMCGSGTLLVEAARIALAIAPGSLRTFGFEHLHTFDAGLWQQVRDAVRKNEHPRTPLAIFGSDLYGDELKKAGETLAAAGLAGLVQLKQANVLELKPPAASGVVVANPPYGVRVGASEDLAAFYPQLGDALKARFAGWRAHLFSADMRLPKLIGLKASKRTPLYNGALECRLFEYRLVAGSMRAGAASAA